MKSLLIALSLFTSVAANTARAAEENVSPVVLKAFAASFANAKDVSWTADRSLYKVHFEMNGAYVTAFYEADGTLVALTRNLTLMQLPVKLQTLLKQPAYQQYWITELFEVSNDDGTSYYLTFENADGKLVLKSAGVDGWGTYKKIRKS